MPLPHLVHPSVPRVHRRRKVDLPHRRHDTVRPLPHDDDDDESTTMSMVIIIFIGIIIVIGLPPVRTA